MPRGGKRPGAGRPRSNPPVKRYEVMLTEEQLKLLLLWGRGNISAGIRWLIDTAKTIIRKEDDDTLCKT